MHCVGNILRFCFKLTWGKVAMQKLIEFVKQKRRKRKRRTKWNLKRRQECFGQKYDATLL